MKRLVLLALLLTASWVTAAPAPLPKPNRKPEPPPPRVGKVVYPGDFIEDVMIVRVRQIVRIVQPAPPPPQPPNADPPG